MNKGYCELPGDDIPTPDGCGRKCIYKGIQNICQLYREETPVDIEGWIRCCDSCKIPFYRPAANKE